MCIRCDVTMQKHKSTLYRRLKRRHKNNQDNGIVIPIYFGAWISIALYAMLNATPQLKCI